MNPAFRKSAVLFSFVASHSQSARLALSRIISLLIFLFAGMYSPTSLAQQGTQLQCDDVFGVRYGVYNSPTFNGSLVIAPIGPPGVRGAELPVAVLTDNPAVALAHFEPNIGFGVFIGRDGSFVVEQNGQSVPTGHCAIVVTGVTIPPPPWGALLNVIRPAPPPIYNSQGVDVANLGPGGNALTGHWPMYATEGQALGCKSHLVDDNDQDAFLNCMTRSMMTAKQAAAVDCLGQDGQTNQVSCVAKVAFPGASGTIDLVQACADADSNSLDWDCVAKQKLTDQQYQAYRCAHDAQSTDDYAACVANLGLSPGAAQALATFQACASEQDEASIATCALSRTGDRRVALAAHCIQNQLNSADFSYVGAAACYGAGNLHLNAELQIAVECGVESGGDPLSFAGCTGGRLTVRELTKCFTNGVGGSGCFGPNNEIVGALRAAGIDVSNLTNPNGAVVNAWNTVTNDIEHGMGPNNDLVRAIGTLNPGNFGPNNDFIKATNTITHDLTVGPGPNNDIVRTVNDAGRGLQNAGDSAKDKLNHAFHLHL